MQQPDGQVREPVTIWRPWLLAAALYGALAIGISWPLVTHLSSVLPYDAYDPALSSWILWWDAHTLPLTARWWAAPFFWPMPGAFALAEHLLGVSLLTTPLQWLGVSAVASYNIAFLASFPLAALAVHSLVFALVRRHDAALVGGLAFAFGPYRMSQLAHIQVLWIFGVPLALMALHRYRETSRRRWLVLFGAAWLVQALSYGYLMLFFPVLLALWIVWYVRDLRQLAAIAAAWLLASLPLLPILFGYQRLQSMLALSRRYEEIEAFGADLRSIVAAAPTVRLWHGLARYGRSEEQFFPGALVLALAVVGAIVAAARAPKPASQARTVTWLRGVCLGGAIVALAAAAGAAARGPWRWLATGGVTIVSVSSPEKPLAVALLLAGAFALSSEYVAAARRRASPLAFYLLAALATFVLAAGPHPRLAGQPALFHGPYWWLLELPGFSALRVPARFGVLVDLSLVVAAAIAFARLTAALSPRARRLTAAVAAAIVLFEGWPQIAMADLPPPLPLAAFAGGDAAILELPAGRVEQDTAAMFRSIGGGVPIVNGYSGYDPVHYLILKTALDAGDERVLDALTRDGTLLVAVGASEPARWSSLVLRHPRAVPLAGDGGWRFYRILRVPADTGMPLLARLPIVAATALDHPEDAARLIDGDAGTAWNSGRPQTGREAVTVDLGSAADVTALRLALGVWYADYPRRLAIDCAGDDNRWQSCWEGSVAALAVDGALADPHNPIVTVRFDGTAVRRLRVRQTGTAALNAWTIAELTVFGRQP